MLAKGNSTLTEFREFISKGNVADLAVGVIIGGAFSKIVTSIVNDILMPLVGVVMGGLDFTNLTLKVGEATITYGNFIQNVIDFLIVSACIFVMIKIITKLNRKANKQEVKKEKAEIAARDEQIVLLEEIRDLLRNS
ncbi:MAG: large-conductance mechanosensitive channel protein MscL [Candidatus Saccharibacteria bacterium]|nr:large-conductance mechanosensitive channel protein MscL [Candidatus Saccharibacteria bacterium]